MADENSFGSKPFFLAIGLGSCVLLVTFFLCFWLSIGICCDKVYLLQRRQPRRRLRPEMQDTTAATAGNMRTPPNSSSPAPQKYYQKGEGRVLVGDDGTCPVCLSEFEDGEEFRTLPECMHSFHVPCIEMWLYSHPTCPICRADATPLSTIEVHRQ